MDRIVAAKQLSQLLQTREAKVAVIGLGYVGLPLAEAFFDVGFTVLGYDTDAERVAALRRGELYFKSVATKSLKRMIVDPRFEVSSDPKLLEQADVVCICVPTPLSAAEEPDLHAVRSAMQSVLFHTRPGVLISLESTTYPYTTLEEVCQPLERIGRKLGHDVFVAYSPEREDPGNRQYRTREVPKLVAGATAACKELACEFYRAAFAQVVPVSSLATAEMTKLVENTYRAVNIALVNDLQVMAEAMQIDVWEVIEAAATKPFGFNAFFPGPGVGGHCLPIDPHYLQYRAGLRDASSRLLKEALAANARRPGLVGDQIITRLREGGVVEGARVLILGVAYKKNVDDVREAPAISIMEQLARMGVTVSYHDPHVPQLRAGARVYQTTDLTAEVVRQADCVAIITDHDEVDYQLLAAHASRIVDTRGRMRK
jgi:UDP-N-acetyl-D-glucosamine dehydrogenase